MKMSGIDGDTIFQGGIFMANDSIKAKIIAELDSRIERLEKHYHDHKPEDNPYSELNHALSHAISNPLMTELRDVRHFVEDL